MQPKENRSERPSTASPRACSGDMKVGVPATRAGRMNVIVYRSGLTKGTGVLSGARRIDVTMSITRIPL